MLSKKILKEEISKTKSTIKTLEKMRVDSAKKGKQIDEDCGVGIEINSFVLLKLEEELKNV
jgi:hypothetical protein